MAAALTVAAVVAAGLCLAPLRAGSRGRPDAGSGSVAAMVTSMPEFVLAAVLLTVGAVWWDLFPPYGWSGPEHLALPALALGLPAGALLGRLLAEAVTTAYREPWVQTWWLAGYTSREVRHAVLRRAVPTNLPQLGLVLVGLTGGAVAVEQVFAIPGLGRTALGAASATDLPLLQMCVLVLLLLGVLIGVTTRVTSRALLGSALSENALSTQAPAARARLSSWTVPAVAATGLVVLIVAGIGRDPYAISFDRLAPPGSRSANGGLALLGADSSGRDVLARVAHGALDTISLALVCAVACWLIGLVIGSFPRLATGPVEAANAIPPVISGLVVAAVLGPSAYGAALAVVLVSWAPLAAHTASLSSEVRATRYLTLTPLIGVGPVRATMTKVLPAIAPVVFRHAMLRLPGIALALAALGFLGLERVS